MMIVMIITIMMMMLIFTTKTTIITLSTQFYRIDTTNNIPSRGDAWKHKLSCVVGLLLAGVVYLQPYGRIIISP